MWPVEFMKNKIFKFLIFLTETDKTLRTKKFQDDCASGLEDTQKIIGVGHFCHPPSPPSPLIGLINVNNT